MLNGAGGKQQLRSGDWEDYTMIVTYLLNVTSIKNKEICPFELLLGCKPKLLTSLKSFGEIGVTTTKAKIQSKLKNRGISSMFVGYYLHHANDVYRILNLDTRSFIQSRDIYLPE
jgi:hypothetical protein